MPIFVLLICKSIYINFHNYLFQIHRKGDYHRYLAEFATGNDRKDAAEQSLVAYKAASDIAMTELPPTHPIRLGECNNNNNNFDFYNSNNL